MQWYVACIAIYNEEIINLESKLIEWEVKYKYYIFIMVTGLPGVTVGGLQHYKNFDKTETQLNSLIPEAF